MARETRDLRYVSQTNLYYDYRLLTTFAGGDGNDVV